MPPIHETDVAEERWSQAEWEHYELWEKIETRMRRRKWMWIGATTALFFVLSAVPIVRDRYPKWISSVATRKLSQEINRIKREASLEHAAFRIRFEHGTLSYVVEKSESCAQPHGQAVRSGGLVGVSKLADYALLSPSQGSTLGIPGLVDSFCYDYLSGSDAVVRGERVVGFGVIPVKDLAEQRLERSSILLLTGPSAEVSFD